MDTNYDKNEMFMMTEKKVKIREGRGRNWTSYVRTVKSAVSHDKAESSSRRTVLTSSSTHITAAVTNIWKPAI